MQNKLTMLVTSDVHHSDEVTDPVGQIIGGDDGSWPMGGKHYRWWINALTALEGAANRATVVSANLLVDTGDMIDGNVTDKATALAAALAKRDLFAGNRANIIGNHENGTPWGGDLATYYAAVESGHVTKANSYDSGRCYTFDVNGVRCIFLGYTTTEMPSGEKTWLADTALDTTLPVVIFSHLQLQPNGTSDFGNYTNADDIITIIEAAGNVQLWIGSHQHLATGGYRYVNDIMYCDMLGSVLGPSDGSEPDGTYYAYFEIVAYFNALKGTNQLRCNIEITGHGRGGSRNLLKSLIA